MPPNACILQVAGWQRQCMLQLAGRAAACRWPWRRPEPHDTQRIAQAEACQRAEHGNRQLVQAVWRPWLSSCCEVLPWCACLSACLSSIMYKYADELRGERTTTKYFSASLHLLAPRVSTASSKAGSRPPSSCWLVHHSPGGTSTLWLNRYKKHTYMVGSS